MKTSTAYRSLPERGVCLKPGCSWHREGPSAQPLAEAHTEALGHPTSVAATSVVTYQQQRMAVTRL